MNISANWLKEFLPDMRQSPAELAELLTAHSFETVVSGRMEIDPSITVVRITALDPHPNADRLQLATLTNGQQEVQVVCGARNIAVGDVVPYAPPGAQVYDEAKERFAVREATIRGQKSPGMLVSLRELGLGSDHAGIMHLPLDTPLGSALSDRLPPDTILDADILPDRAPDAGSHLGIAREVAALLGLEVQEPEKISLPIPGSQADGWAVAIEDAADTPRYLAAMLRGLRNGISPLWLQQRLLAAGSRPINILVDITNYAMFEIGNPTHLFDANKLPGKALSVRRARSGETMMSLDGIVRTFDPTNLVIASQDIPVAAAGVIGGADTQVEDTTTAGLLEVANFRSYTIQQSAARLGLRTESSDRFRRGIDRARVSAAAARAITLFQHLAGAELVGVIDTNPKPVSARQITFSPGRTTAVAGAEVPAAGQQDILTRLRFQIDSQSDPWQVIAPADRLDITGSHDLVEEVLRVWGLKNIPGKVSDTQPSVQLPSQMQWREAIRSWLVSAGLTETYNYSFSVSLPGQSNDKKSLTLINPVSPEQKHLRTDLLPGLLAQAAKNRAVSRTQYLFEIGRVYLPDAGERTRVPGVREIQHLAGIIIEERDSRRVAQGIVTSLLEYCGLTPDDLPAIGGMVRVPKQLLNQIKVPAAAACFELDLDALIQRIDQEAPYIHPAAGLPASYQPFSKYPPVFRDISMIVPSDIRIESVQEIIERVGGEMVENVDLFDIYDRLTDSQDRQAREKGLAFHVRYRAPDRTLTDAEVNEIHGNIIRQLEQEIGAKIR